MQRSEVLEQVQSIVRFQFDDPSIIVDYDTVVDAIPDWDSIAHVQIIVAIENHFHIVFNADQYIEFENIGELIDCTLALIGDKALMS